MYIYIFISMDHGTQQLYNFLVSETLSKSSFAVSEVRLGSWRTSNDSIRIPTVQGYTPPMPWVVLEKSLVNMLN